MEQSPVFDYVGPRKLSTNQYEKFKRYSVIGFDGKDISKAKREMSAEELIQIRSKENIFNSNDTCLNN
jgi:hypothetical protein